MASITNSGWQNREERPNRSTNDGDIVNNTKRDVSETVTSNYRDDELLKLILSTISQIKQRRQHP